MGLLAASALLAATAGPAGARPEEYAGGKPDRIHGTDRYETSRAVADTLLASADPAERIRPGGAVVIASGEAFPDALSAASLAGSEGAPIILWPSDPDHLSTAAQERLVRRLRPDVVYVIGGTTAISDEAIANLDARSIRRLGGQDRFDTSYHTTLEAFGHGQRRAAPAEWCMSDMPAAFMVSGRDYPDAVGVSAAAYAGVIPVILADPSDSSNHHIPDGSQKLLDSLYDGVLGESMEDCIAGTPEVLLVGGHSAVPAATAAELGRQGFEVSRVSGSDRYETNYRLALDLAERCPACYHNPGVVLATGENFPDALSASALAGLRGDMMLLVPPADRRGSDEGTYWLKETVNTESVFTSSKLRTVIIGGEAAIPDGLNLFDVTEGPITDDDGTWPGVADAWAGGFTHRGDVRWEVSVNPSGTKWIDIEMSRDSFTDGGYAAAWRMYVPRLPDEAACPGLEADDVSVFPTAPASLTDRNGDLGKILYLCFGENLTAGDAADLLNADPVFSRMLRASVRSGSRSVGLIDMPRAKIYQSVEPGATLIGVFVRMDREVDPYDLDFPVTRLIGVCDVEEGPVLRAADGGSCYGAGSSERAVRSMVGNDVGILMTVDPEATMEHRRTLVSEGRFDANRIVYIQGLYGIDPATSCLPGEPVNDPDDPCYPGEPVRYSMTQWRHRAPSHDHAVLGTSEGLWVPVRRAIAGDVLGATTWPD